MSARGRTFRSAQSAELHHGRSIEVDDGTTVADVNADRYVIDDVVRVIYPVAGQTHIDNHEPYAPLTDDSSAQRRFTAISKENRTRHLRRRFIPEDGGIIC